MYYFILYLLTAIALRVSEAAPLRVNQLIGCQSLSISDFDFMPLPAIPAKSMTQPTIKMFHMTFMIITIMMMLTTMHTTTTTTMIFFSTSTLSNFILNYSLTLAVITGPVL